MDAKSTDFEIKITVKPSEYLRTSERVTEFYLTFPKSLPPPPRFGRLFPSELAWQINQLAHCKVFDMCKR